MKLYWTYDKCKEEALKYKARGEFSQKNPTAYQRALRKEWLDEICVHMISLRDLGLGSSNKNIKKRREYHRKYGKVYRKNPKAKERKQNLELKRKYNISLEQFNVLSADQRNKCAICGEERKLVIDHDHETGKIRGLLCTICNKGLGLFYDNENLLKNAIDYLIKSKQHGI